MSSLLPDYEYDIFISYRQKDNKYDGWVTEFVSNLKKELEATFKEDISIYFDENPHDGLLETHNVDKSLENKLRCLVFIPILSQTYCDPKSFAWQHEFCVFNKLAKDDLLGRDIKLNNGNVSSRILPIKIHDLDTKDQSTYETEIGGILRAIDFIYKEPGVNRPLHPSDNRNDNQNKTGYRNQVNKVANAIKELITSMSAPAGETKGIRTQYEETVPKGLRKQLMVGAAGLILLGILSFSIYYFTDFTKQFRLQKSIALLPFENMSNDPEQEYFIEGVSEDIINHLVNISNLNVMSRNSTLQFKGSMAPIPEIGRKLGVSNLLAGSIQKSGKQIHLVVKLIDTSTDRQIWSQTYDREVSEIFKIQSEISLAIAEALKIRLSSQEEIKVSNSVSKIPEAYDLYLKGVYEYRKYTLESTRRGIKFLSEAVALDSSFSYAYAGLATVYIASAAIFSAEREALDALELAKPLLDKALQLDPGNENAHSFLAFYYLYHDWDFAKAENEYIIADKLNKKDPDVTSLHADFENFLRRPEQALVLSERQLQIDPYFPNPRKVLTLFYLNRQDEALSFIKSRVGSFDNYWTYDAYGFVALNSGHFDEAIQAFDKAIAILGVRAPRMLGWMGAAYAKKGERDKANLILNELIERREVTNAGSVNFFIAVVYSALGEKENALEWLQRAIKDHDMEIPWLISEPQFYNLHKDAKFLEMVRKVGFPEESIRKLNH